MNPKKTRTVLVHITTVPESLGFLRGQISYTKARGFEVLAISSPGSFLDKFGQAEQVVVHGVAMPRRVTPLRDLQAIGRVWQYLRAIKPAIVHSHTPKGGLIGMIAAWLTRVPVRVYHIHGMPYLTATGTKRVLLRLSEKVSCRLAHQVLCVSNSVRTVAVSDGICPDHKIKVLAGGSINGVDAAERFNPLQLPAATRSETRACFGIPEDAVVAGYVGRLVRDKGIVELVAAWRVLRGEYPQLHLLVVGPFEPQDPVPPEARDLLETDPRVHLTGLDWNTPPLYRAMDLVVLPTYREGFPVVPLEAAAMQLPVVSTTVPGCVDAVQDGVTGTLVPPKDATALANAVRMYLNDPDLRRRHGEAGRERVLRDFRPEVIWEAMHREYCSLLRAKGLPAPTGAKERT